MSTQRYNVTLHPSKYLKRMEKTIMPQTTASRIAEIADFDLLDEDLATDVKSSLAGGKKGGAIFEVPGPPVLHLREAVKHAIKAIEAKDRSALLPRFLEFGPLVKDKKYLDPKRNKRLSDDETAAAIRLIFSSAINSFQGQLAEMLAMGAVLKLQKDQPALQGAVLHIGDAVKARKLNKNVWAKAADMHLLAGGGGAKGDRYEVRGLVEVKSYRLKDESLMRQLDRHATRARRGLYICGEEVPAKSIQMGGRGIRPVKIAVVPDEWPMPRSFAFETQEGKNFLVVEPPKPPRNGDRIESLGKDGWKITLRWSEEALSAAAYGLTYWYMGELGRVIYECGLPPELSEMMPEQAGQNAVVQSLYYAMLRARTVRESSRAIALYNSYGFGYPLGANFVDWKGRRQELFPEDLYEILATGRSRTKALDKKHPAQLCRIRGL